jgi:hypothetical protein
MAHDDDRPSARLLARRRDNMVALLFAVVEWRQGEKHKGVDGLCVSTLAFALQSR